MTTRVPTATTATPSSITGYTHHAPAEISWGAVTSPTAQAASGGSAAPTTGQLWPR